MLTCIRLMEKERDCRQHSCCLSCLASSDMLVSAHMIPLDGGALGNVILGFIATTVKGVHICGEQPVCSGIFSLLNYPVLFIPVYPETTIVLNREYML